MAWWQACGVRGIIIGGLAVSILGRPRATADVDAVVLLEEDRWEQFLHAGGQFAFLPRMSDALPFAHQSRMLLFRHQPSGIAIDISLAGIPFEDEAVARAVTKTVAGVSVPLPTPEDLIIMKAVAHRARDFGDIEGLLDVAPKLDKRRIRRWVAEFARALEMPELLEDLEKLLTKRRFRKKKGTP
jgi:hypothetical protein